MRPSNGSGFSTVWYNRKKTPHKCWILCASTDRVITVSWSLLNLKFSFIFTVPCAFLLHYTNTAVDTVQDEHAGCCLSSSQMSLKSSVLRVLWRKTAACSFLTSLNIMPGLFSDNLTDPCSFQAVPEKKKKTIYFPQYFIFHFLSKQQWTSCRFYKCALPALGFGAAGCTVYAACEADCTIVLDRILCYF